MKDYGVRDLIKVFARAQNSRDYPEMRDYNMRFYIALSSVLKVKIDLSNSEPSQSRILLNHFQTTINSYNNQINPYSGYLEAGLLHRSIERLGERGTRIQEAESILMDCAKSILELHLDYLEAMFVGLWGEITVRANHDELTAQGFDPLSLPDIDY